jgi:hypothetical protein
LTSRMSAPKNVIFHGVHYHSYEINPSIKKRAHFLAITGLGNARTRQFVRMDVVRPKAPRRRAPRCQ